MLNVKFLFLSLVWILSQGSMALVFRGKCSVLASLMFENIQLHVSRGPELMTKAFLPCVIYFGLEMSFFVFLFF